MSTTTSSASYYNLGNHQCTRRRSHAPVFSPYCLPGISTIMHGYQISAIQVSHQFNINNGVIAKRYPKMKIHASNNSQSGAPPPAKSPSSAWKHWILGIILSMFLPFLKHKGGLLVSLKNNVDMAIETMECVAEVVEHLAEEVEKVADEVEDKLPDDAKLKEAVSLIEDLAKEAVKKAKLAEEIIHKVKEVEKEVEKAFMEPTIDQEKVDRAQTPEDLDALVKRSNEL
ncbi:hypothetical protein HHK36_009549 [Tetracentron sinense]|uniref:Uncharacterized protein n=1 Tax=Tetracentron sinense TaxID=13715 RepID=A0A834ZJ53_TETSI|nr:hypothetical protein HHK36_009549 [Tetracentron sinense]